MGGGAQSFLKEGEVTKTYAPDGRLAFALIQKKLRAFGAELSVIF